MAAQTFTYAEQHRPYPSSGDALTEDGSPLHSRLGIDAILSVNNLAMSMPFVGFAQSYNTKLTTAISARNNCTTAPAEWFAAQLPTVLPVDAVRFCWTLGLKIANVTDVSPGDSVISLDAVNVYAAPTPYSDVMMTPDPTDGMVFGAYRAFDLTKLGGPNRKTVVAPALSITNGPDPAYALIDNSAGSLSALPFVSLTSGGLSRMNFIITTTAHCTTGGTGSLVIDVEDFTWWVLPQ